MFLKNGNIISKIRRSKVTNYAALNGNCQLVLHAANTINTFSANPFLLAGHNQSYYTFLIVIIMRVSQK